MSTHAFPDCLAGQTQLQKGVIEFNLFNLFHITFFWLISIWDSGSGWDISVYRIPFEKLRLKLFKPTSLLHRIPVPKSLNEAQNSLAEIFNYTPDDSKDLRMRIMYYVFLCLFLHMHLNLFTTFIELMVGKCLPFVVCLVEFWNFTVDTTSPGVLVGGFIVEKKKTWPWQLL